MALAVLVEVVDARIARGQRCRRRPPNTAFGLAHDAVLHGPEPSVQLVPLRLVLGLDHGEGVGARR